LICRKRCLFCRHKTYIFNRGSYCKEHSWRLCNRYAQCFKEMSLHNYRLVLDVCAIFVCHVLYPRGGYLYERKGRGAVPAFDCIDLHHDDSARSLQFIAKWINEASEYAEKDTQCLLLDEIFKGTMAFFEKLK